MALALTTCRPPSPLATEVPALAFGRDNSYLTYDCTSSFKIRPLRPVPLTKVKSTPNSRPIRRIEGEV